MNPMLIILAIIAATILWFLLAFAFRPFGRFIKRIWNDAMTAINKEDEKEKKE